MQLCLFEDAKYTNFHPLTLTRPVDDLRFGILTISTKWKYVLDVSSVARMLRPELNGVFDRGQIDTSQHCLWINNRYLPRQILIENINNLNAGQCIQHGDTVIAAKVDGESSARWLEEGSPDFNTLFVLESSDFPCIGNLWDLFQQNGQEIVWDLELMSFKSDGNADISDHAVLANRDDIFVQDGATIEAGCVLNAKHGPIFVGKDATIMAGSVIRGPAAICEGSTVKQGASIYEDTTVGPICKVGGEISNTIFHSYSNKAHDGYIGNSVVGQWVNIGAGTTVSNLKTNYSSIRIADWETNEEQDTGLQFFGVVFGDHSKTAINCVINSGTVCGVSSNILSRDFPPKLIHSFSWVSSNVIHPYKLDKALETMEIMMSRRGVSMTDEYRNMMESISEKSKQPTG